MNISFQSADIPLVNVANQATASLRRDNAQRDLITKPEASAQPGAEKGVASDSDKSQTPSQNVDSIDFESIQEQIELENTTVNENPDDTNEQADQDQDNEEELAASDENSDTEEESQPPEVEFREEIQALESRDQEVRTHELAHVAAGGQYAGTPQYQYTIGPDGQRYITDGEVSIDLSPIDGDPAATITKLDQVINSALAPAEPSTQDRQVAAQAAQLILQAQSELAEQRTAELENTSARNEGSEGALENSAETNTANQFSSTDISTTTNDNNFDQFVNATIASQEQVVPTRSEDVDARAERIERFYNAITQAFDERPSSNFQIAV